MRKSVQKVLDAVSDEELSVVAIFVMSVRGVCYRIPPARNYTEKVEALSDFRKLLAQSVDCLDARGLGALRRVLRLWRKLDEDLVRRRGVYRRPPAHVLRAVVRRQAKADAARAPMGATQHRKTGQKRTPARPARRRAAGI